MKKLLVAAGLMLASSSAFAVSLTPTTNLVDGTTFNTTGISSYNTYGSDMVGIEVTAIFSNGSSVDATFDGANATGSLFNLNYSGGSTFGGTWSLTNNSDAALLSLIIHGAPGDTVFDTLGDDTHTPGSALGGPGSVSPSNVNGDADMDVVFTYFNKVTLDGVFYNDLYEALQIDVTNMFSGDVLSWTTDTDNSAIKGDIVQVSEPASLAIFALGLAGIAARRRKQA